MIFSRRYVFEGRRARTRRFLLNALVVLSIPLVAYATLLAWVLMTAKAERARWAEGLYQKAPDAIVVFTGDGGRLRRALELLKKWPEAPLLISGVHGSNSFKTLVAGQADEQALLETSSQVELDYEALDTEGNVRETLEHVALGASRPQRMLVVTSDYHVFRVRMLFEKQVGRKGPPLVFYEGIPTPRWDWGATKKLLKESIKIARTWLIL